MVEAKFCGERNASEHSGRPDLVGPGVVGHAFYVFIVREIAETFSSVSTLDIKILYPE